MRTPEPVSVADAEPTTDVRRYRAVRHASTRIAAPLSPEDAVVQSMPDASPVKWHLAHTSWFFETFVLEGRLPEFRPHHPAFRVLYNSYYNQIGAQHPRPQRGLISRPSLADVLRYREHVDSGIETLLARPAALDAQTLALIELGTHHEQQHQELMLMDLKHLFSCNPLYPEYAPAVNEPARRPTAVEPLRFVEYPGGQAEIGAGATGFAFDNERPRHATLLTPYALGTRLTTNGEFMAFVDAGGYQRPELWLADGWASVQREHWQHPFYWRCIDGAWHEFTLHGLVPLDPTAPASHVSYYEADAYAAWYGARLPTEHEWEHAAQPLPVRGHFMETGHYHPRPAGEGTGLRQMYGDLWEWTRSCYGPYPGYRAPAGAVGEYNGKFMCNQLVLRGGACVTPRSHVRASYRNFFYPHTRWHFSGIRLARDPA
ncbi:MAG: ergothioneine biosynthesis protein EgtB [Gammaproteobacteria bacterium]|nr:ergothioneine biosynthesis protein EgtB [Gammaproteobacteria bacterium]